MKNKITNIVLLVFVLFLNACETPVVRSNGKSTQYKYKRVDMFSRVTVYWARGGRGSDRETRQHKCATGLRLQQGSCAVDPRRIPYGSRVYYSDGSVDTAIDTGTAVRNRKAARRGGRSLEEKGAVVIDRFFEYKKQALAWANTNPPFMHVKVEMPIAEMQIQPFIKK